MHCSNPVALLTLVVASTALGQVEQADVPKRFCEAWTKATTPGRDYDEVLEATLRSVKAGGDWGELFGGIRNHAKAFHLQMLREAAKEHHTTFSCEAFEFPAGRPTGKMLLAGDDVLTATALAADDTGVFWLSCERSRNRNCRLLRLEGTASKVLEANLPEAGPHSQLLLDGKDVVMLVGGNLLSVPKVGGTRTVLATKIDRPRALVREGDFLVLIAGDEVVRLPRKGGEPVVVGRWRNDALGKNFPGTNQPDFLAPYAGGFYFNGSEGPLFYVPSPGKPPEKVATGSNPRFPVMLGGALYFQTVGSEDVYSLNKFDLASRKVTPLGPQGAGTGCVADSVGQLLCNQVARGDWPGKASIVRWKQGAPRYDAVATGVGQVSLIAGDSKRVYWVDRWYGGLMAAPRGSN